MKYSIRCSTLPTPRKDGTLTVRLRVSWMGRRVTHYISAPIDPNGWDDAARRPKPSQRKALKEINELTAAVDRLFDERHLARLSPTELDVKIALGDIRQGLSSDTVSDSLKRFIREMSSKRSWEPNTLRNYHTFENSLVKWRGGMQICEFNDNAVQRYIAHLYSSGDSNPTVKKYYRMLRTFLEWCCKVGVIQDESWKDYQPTFKGEAAIDENVIYLSEEELQRVIDLDLSEDKQLERVRDVFLFCCFTGVRYSDVAKIEWADVHDGYIEVVTKKTRDRLRIELNDFSAAILDRYKIPTDDKSRRTALPTMSNQKMNQYLKTIGRMADLTEPVRCIRWVKNDRIEEVVPKWQKLTTHCGRKTFIVTALTLEIPAVVIMRWTGHSDYDAMRPYVRIVDKLKESSMAKFNTFGKKK